LKKTWGYAIIPPELLQNNSVTRIRLGFDLRVHSNTNPKGSSIVRKNEGKWLSS
jgi:hypothetical protein